MFEDKKLTVQLYRRVAACIAVAATEGGPLQSRLRSMRDSFLNAAACVEESLEAYAKAEGSLPVGSPPAAASLAEAIEGHLAGGSPPGLEPKRPAASVNVARQLDETTLWGK